MDKHRIFEVALSFRTAIQTARKKREFFNQHDRMNNFPGGCCDDSADLLGYYLRTEHHISSKQGNGLYKDEHPYNTTNHAWVELSDGTVIDITADQFLHFSKCPNGIFIGTRNSFYNNLDDVRIYEHYDITQNPRLWHDYQAICRYLSV